MQIKMILAWNTCGRCSWLGKISFLLISVWLLTIIISVNHIFNHNSGNNPDSSQADKIDQEKLVKITNKFQQLKEQNDALRNVLFGYG